MVILWLKRSVQTETCYPCSTLRARYKKTAGRKTPDGLKLVSLSVAADRHQACGLEILGFFNGDGARFTDLHTGFTAQAFFGVDGVRLAVFDFIHFHRADVYAFATAHALVGVNTYIVTHCVLQKKSFCSVGSEPPSKA